MLSYIGKFIILLSVLYTLLIPSAIINAFADENITIENSLPQERGRKDNLAIRVSESNKKNDIQKADNISETELPGFITKNIQTVGNILSSSSSELVEQAKSYALGKFNSTIASEAQKWLSQFGTAKINFGFDRKGKLENNSLDLLLPLYDNKTNWLLFSQLGYRNKDSRNTVNLGLGGRYFYQNWMYGLNTFYDHDLTGKNKRIGFGGEIWGDYIKLSANTYRRLSDWQISRNFEEHHERPANGYDINGEFFLPAYPNLGGKLTYEQYFGENVTLFNRYTKQKNPSLVKLGVTYTPIPLITIGVDYRQGEGGRSETQFLANLNYRLGVPLGTQLSPENVAAMRTLAGERYDLAERNNNIVLDHRKIPIAQFLVAIPEEPKGYRIKGHILTVKADTDGGNASEDKTTSTESEGKVRTEGEKISEKETAAKKTLPANDESKFIYTATIIDRNGKQVEDDEKIPNVRWALSIDDNPINPANNKHGLTLQGHTKPKQGTLTATLTSNKSVENVLVTLFIDHPVREDAKCTKEAEEAEQCANAEAPVSFKSESFEIKEFCLMIDNKCTEQLKPSDILTGNGKDKFTYQATIYKKGSNKPLQGEHKISAEWKTNFEARTYKGEPEWKVESDNTVRDGKMTGTLTSQVGIGDIESGQIIDGLAVELTVPGDSKSAIPVAFEIPAPITTGVVVYVKEADNRTIKKSKIFEDQLRPSNVFGNMYAQLYDLSIKKKIMDEGGEIISTKGFRGGINDFWDIDMTTGEITLGSPLQTKKDTSITIKRTNKAKYTYNYSFWVKKIIKPNVIHPGVMKQDSEEEKITCLSPVVPYLRNINELDIGIGRVDIYSLQSEFPDSYSWGILDAVTPPPPVTPNILGRYLRNADRGNFIYNTQKNEEVGDLKGYVLCVASYFSH
ncbi:inverse autotransporter beta domain-containing protein [Xenorhabdus sp. SGI246]|uniref:inverse autotransporter beta domain-containing protein n=1 Tax=Xenorhabdus sp. SGI246 TaxID=3158263 RepID=UPI00349FA35A